MNTIHIFKDKFELGAAAAKLGAEKIRATIAWKGYANIILATGASQFEMLAALLKEPGIDWSVIRIFHLDEYIGIPVDHPAGFRKYLWERFVSKLPVPPRAFYGVNGSAKDVKAAIAELGEIITANPIDVAFVGIGENGHLAFNDPPADLDIETPYLIIDLEERCRKQQLGEGWFPTLEDVPKQAISMSCRQIMKSRSIINTVPDKRKAEAVKAAIEGPVTNMVASSILRYHPDCNTFLDVDSASLLENK
ncbi:MAG: glucosamine-6-phosphate deaminase [Victivallales bacterium]|nr:glucosamine-6-phosphate deaminase [Victivallales bacterium]